MNQRVSIYHIFIDELIKVYVYLNIYIFKCYDWLQRVEACLLPGNHGEILWKNIGSDAIEILFQKQRLKSHLPYITFQSPFFE